MNSKYKPEKGRISRLIETRGKDYAMSQRRQRPPKYGNQKIDGYDSIRERSRARRLRLLEEAGVIADLREQVVFDLLPPQRDKDGRVIERSCKYIADFVYRDLETGETVVEDVKGMRTDVYRIKRKLMLYIHGIRVREI